MNKKENEGDIPMNVEIEQNGKLYAFKSPKQKEVLILDKNYLNFPSFYQGSKEQIYRKIVETYEKMISSGKEEMSLTVLGYIHGEPFNTEFTIVLASINDELSNSDFIIAKYDPSFLLNVINPYFESIEDYETCDKIMKLYAELKS